MDYSSIAKINLNAIPHEYEVECSKLKIDKAKRKIESLIRRHLFGTTIHSFKAILIIKNEQVVDIKIYRLNDNSLCEIIFYDGEDSTC